MPNIYHSSEHNGEKMQINQKNSTDKKMCNNAKHENIFFAEHKMNNMKQYEK